MDLYSHSDTWFPIQWAKVAFLLKASWQPVSVVHVMAFPHWPQVVCTDLFPKPDSNMTLFSNFTQDCILIFYWFDCIFISEWWPEKWSWWCTILNTRAQYFSIYWVRSEMWFMLFLFSTLCSLRFLHIVVAFWFYVSCACLMIINTVSSVDQLLSKYHFHLVCNKSLITARNPGLTHLRLGWSCWWWHI